MRVALFLLAALLPIFWTGPVFASETPKPIRKATFGARGRHPAKSASIEGEKGVVNIRGGADLELNCPSISYKFPEHSTLRCESCKTMGRVLHYAIVHYFREPEDMLISGPTQRGPELCVMAFVSELRQKTNGRRFWDLTRLMKTGDLIEHSPYVDHDYDPLPESHTPETRKQEIAKARAAGHGEFSIEDPTDYPVVATNDKAISVNNRRVTYHTQDERETLPCANYFLNRYCMTEFLGDDDTADAVDGCVNTYKAVRKSQEASIKASAKKRLAELQEAAGAGGAASYSLVELEAEERARVDMSSTTQRLSTSLLNCLTGKICGSLHRNECDTRQLIEMQKGERDAFLRYEAKYGNKENPFVGTALDARKLERNPYASKASHSGEL